jgi:UDP-N-acetylmuramoylalanine--D-glutamate ligase
MMTTNKFPHSSVTKTSTDSTSESACGADWLGKHVLVIGAARQGLALARYLARNGAQVVLNDMQSGEKIEEACKKVTQSLPSGCCGTVNWVLGGHPISLLENIELVCVSGGVPLDLPILTEACNLGIPITNDSQVFMECVPCKVIGITGSAGKSTTTSLVGKMAQAVIENHVRDEKSSKVWIGGNIGLPLIDLVDQIKSHDLVILELSSFQLELMTISPHISGILNITPNHLDRHGTMSAYTNAKRRILDFQSGNDVAVLGRDDPGAWGLKPFVKGHLMSFGLLPADEETIGTYIDGERLYLKTAKSRYALIHRDDIRLRGEHNLLNILAAYTIIYAAGLITRDGSGDQVKALAIAVRDFSGMPHRLELVRILNGVSWYNDSIATSPERTIAAINSFDEPIVLLLGGRDKDLPWEKLSELVRQRVDHVILFGEAADKIFNVLKPPGKNGLPYSLDLCTSLKSAVDKAVSIVHPGDVVLLSPGGTSFDEFIDFEERGEKFREWIHRLP